MASKSDPRYKKIITIDHMENSGGGDSSDVYFQDGEPIFKDTFEYPSTSREFFDRYQDKGAKYYRTLYGQNNGCGDDPWRESVSFKDYYGTALGNLLDRRDVSEKKLTKKGTFPQFNGRGSYDSGNIYIKRTDSLLTIYRDGDSESAMKKYSPSDFDDGVIPKFLFVMLVGAGGGGDHSNTSAETIGQGQQVAVYMGGGGGGGGGFVAFVLNLTKAPEYRVVVGAAGKGATNNASSSPTAGTSTALQVKVNGEWENIAVAGGGGAPQVSWNTSYGGAGGGTSLGPNYSKYGYVLDSATGASGGDGCHRGHFIYSAEDGGTSPYVIMRASNNQDEVNRRQDKRQLSWGGYLGGKCQDADWGGGGGGGGIWGTGGKGGKGGGGSQSNGQKGNGRGSGGGGGAWVIAAWVPGGNGTGGYVAFYA